MAGKNKYKKPQKKPPCRFFNTPAGCNRGDSCNFSHEPMPESSQDAPLSGRVHAANSDETIIRRPARHEPPTNVEAEFRNWRFGIPTDSQRIKPLGRSLPKFFQRARELIGQDRAITQEVIERLASEGGLSRIRELCDDIEDFDDQNARQILTSSVLPLFEVVSDPDVLASPLLEQFIGTLYNFLHGVNGRRATALFNFVLHVLRQYDLHSLPSALEISISVFAKIVDFNGSALVNPSLHQAAKDLADLALKLDGDLHAALLVRITKTLGRLQRRLGVGCAMPLANVITTKPSTTRAKFVIQQHPAGGRHDNDYDDILNIKIMPTCDEIKCLQREYLPVTDPTEWHLPGIDGLLDRHFRLLREDTVGQLRDAVRPELDRLQGSAQSEISRQQGQRTYTYQNATVFDIFVDAFQGLSFYVSIDQPTATRNRSQTKRQEWWEHSRRLQKDALVCFIDASGTAIFCSVASPAKKKERGKEVRHTDNQSGLFEDPEKALVLLTLISPDSENVKLVLDLLCARMYHESALVEFPGVLVPSFQPTLLALQEMKKSGDLPFSEFLAPSTPGGSKATVPPPTYTLQPGFRFNLKTIMRDHKDLWLSATEPFDIKALQDGSTLDDAQAVALVDSLTRSLALVQGPPGTGKSYTGVAMIQVLLDNQRKRRARATSDIGPIICVCYTNHALDQLLEHLVHAGISQIIRVGSRSKSEILAPLNLREVSKQVANTKTEAQTRYKLKQELTKIEKELLEIKNDLGQLENWDGLKKFLLQEFPDHLEEMCGPDEEGFEEVVYNEEDFLHNWLKKDPPVSRPGPPRSIEDILDTLIKYLSGEERQVLHKHWLQTMKQNGCDRFIASLAEFYETKSKINQLRSETDLRALQESNIIGVTTSGLARNLPLLRRLQSKVMMCEEAGEVLEAHTLTAFLPSVEHAILIGDHLQLRPQVQNYELARENPKGKQYSFDTSLFERLVEPETDAAKVPYTTLETQRRMHPSVSRLIRETLYPALTDAESVADYPEVVGIRKRLFWLDHHELEAGQQSEVDQTSKWNPFEVDMTTALVNHLVIQGAYQPEEIAILTPYLGQLQYLRKRLGESYAIVVDDRDEEILEKAGLSTLLTAAPRSTNGVMKTTLLKALRIATVDNFQGEEAKVIIISLVRSNLQNKVGFLRTSNRINVLLSRAKHGMYIIGNSQTTGHSVPMWANVITMLKEEGNLGPQLELQCPRHPDTVILVSKPDHFATFSPEGGCNLKCGSRLACGHSCQQRCHSDALHAGVFCMEPCPRPINGCDHPCPKPCGKKCPTQCKVIIFDASRVLPCGHEAPNLSCWLSQDLSLVKCNIEVPRTVPKCEHEIIAPCYEDVSSGRFECPEKCSVILGCGHRCGKQCKKCITRSVDGNVENSDIVAYKTNHGDCKQRCDRPYTTCNHTCTKACHGEEPCPPCERTCENRCSHSQCAEKCSEPCRPCAESICASECPHSRCTMPCAAPCNHIPCSKRCPKQLICGHQCPSVCGENCPPAKFCQICANPEVMKIRADLLMLLAYEEIDLDENPCIFPRCGHILTIESMDGHMDIQKYYETDAATGTFTGIKSISEPFSMNETKGCPDCRATLREFARYGRIVRRAMIDEATKKFIVWSNQQYVPLAKRLQEQQDKFAYESYDQDSDDRDDNENGDTPTHFIPRVGFAIEGTPADQIAIIKAHFDRDRYQKVIKLCRDIRRYHGAVHVEAQPFQRVYDLVQNARRRGGTVDDMEYDQTILQIRGYLLACALLSRCELIILSDALSLLERGNSRDPLGQIKVDLSRNMAYSVDLANWAQSSQHRLQEVEGHVFFARYAAMHMRFSEADRAQLSAASQEHIDAAKALKNQYSGQTRAMHTEIDDAERMLNGGTFYSTITTEEMRAVVAAMATEFRGTGHWYYCTNGHPFTIGECGAPMERARCPQCNAQIGGQHHTAIEGVTRANDLEEQMGRLDI